MASGLPPYVPRCSIILTGPALNNTRGQLLTQNQIRAGGGGGIDRPGRHDEAPRMLPTSSKRVKRLISIRVAATIEPPYTTLNAQRIERQCGKLPMERYWDVGQLVRR